MASKQFKAHDGNAIRKGLGKFFGAASGCPTCSRKSPDGVIGTLKFLCPSEGRNGARIANSNSSPECLVTGAEFVWTSCTTPPSRLIVICEKLVSRANLAGTQTH